MRPYHQCRKSIQEHRLIITAPNLAWIGPGASAEPKTRCAPFSVKPCEGEHVSMLLRTAGSVHSGQHDHSRKRPHLQPESRQGSILLSGVCGLGMVGLLAFSVQPLCRPMTTIYPCVHREHLNESCQRDTKHEAGDHGKKSAKRHKKREREEITGKTTATDKSAAT